MGKKNRRKGRAASSKTVSTRSKKRANANSWLSQAKANFVHLLLSIDWDSVHTDPHTKKSFTQDISDFQLAPDKRCQAKIRKHVEKCGGHCESTKMSRQERRRQFPEIHHEIVSAVVTVYPETLDRAYELFPTAFRVLDSVAERALQIYLTNNLSCDDELSSGWISPDTASHPELDSISSVVEYMKNTFNLGGRQSMSSATDEISGAEEVKSERRARVRFADTTETFEFGLSQEEIDEKKRRSDYIVNRMAQWERERVAEETRGMYGDKFSEHYPRHGRKSRAAKRKRERSIMASWDAFYNES